MLRSYAEFVFRGRDDKYIKQKIKTAIGLFLLTSYALIKDSGFIKAIPGILFILLTSILYPVSASRVDQLIEEAAPNLIIIGSPLFLLSMKLGRFIVAYFFWIIWLPISFIKFVVKTKLGFMD